MLWNPRRFVEACTPQHTASIGCVGFADVDDADDIPEPPVGRPLAASISPERIVEAGEARQNRSSQQSRSSIG